MIRLPSVHVRLLEPSAPQVESCLLGCSAGHRFLGTTDTLGSRCHLCIDEARARWLYVMTTKFCL